MKDPLYIIAENLKNPLAILKEINGYYECPKDENGNRLGPLVAYAGKYDSPRGKKAYVGEVYANFSIAEQYPVIMKAFANWVIEGIPEFFSFDVVCGPQLGGFAIGQKCADISGKRFAYIEKVVTKLATKRKREESHLAFLRHNIRPGDRVVLTEDVLNNFSTTKEALTLIEAHGGKVVCIIGLLNRSPSGIEIFEHNGRAIPVHSLVTKKIDEWKQEDIEVIKDVKAGNVVMKPKNDWDRLVMAMEQAKTEHAE